jgi:5-methylcytosine-specific restriction endonuclease McrA
MMPKTPFDFLCGMQCIVGDQVCPAIEVCPENKNLVKGMFIRYQNCCRRELKYRNEISLQFRELEAAVRHRMVNGFMCQQCGATMTINNGQTSDDTIYTVEHKLPLAEGGFNEITNLSIICRKCNWKNNDKKQGKKG